MASKPITLIAKGVRFGNWIVVIDLGNVDFGYNQPVHTLLVQCKCGTKRKITYSTLRRNIRKQCHNCMSKSYFVHGMKDTEEYHSWQAMRQRCLNKNSKDYPRWGGRGIKICKRWNDFLTFYKDMGKKPTDRHSIDRINNMGNYKPSNCRWATPLQQVKNRRNTPANERLAV